MNAQEQVAALLAEHTHPGELLTVFGEAWMVCTCGHRIDLVVENDAADATKGNADHRAHVAQALAAAGLLAAPESDPAREADDARPAARYRLAWLSACAQRRSARLLAVELQRAMRANERVREADVAGLAAAVRELADEWEAQAQASGSGALFATPVVHSLRALLDTHAPRSTS